MMKKQRILGIAVGALAMAGTLAAVEVKELNLLTGSKFLPVEMHGRTTAAYGWGMDDEPRRKAGGLRGKYLSGEGLFDIEVKDGILTIKYPEKLHPVYKKGGIVKLVNVHPNFGLAGGKYHIKARVKVERGRFSFSDGTVVKNGPEWQNIDYVGDRRVASFSYRPVANGGFSITDITVCPEYPELGGEINLPDGGKLTKLLLPENADQMMRFCIASWQQWLYTLTGTALPVEVVPEVKPTPGALAVVMGETAPGGWQIKVDKAGVVVTCGESATFIPALFDYLRHLGYTHYTHNQPKFDIKADPAYVLKAIDKKVVPHFRYFVYGPDAVGNSDRNMLYTRNTVDYFHLYKPTMDHVLNVALPSEIYFKKHPEYYALDERGKRTVADYIIRTSPCFANQDAFEIAARNMVKYALQQPKRPHLLFYIGDGGHSCLCDECAKVNRGIKGNYSQMMLRFYNRLAKEMQIKSPGMRVAFGAYSDYQEPPLGIPPEPNLYCTYAISHKRGFPCTMHQECELNKRGFDEVREWSKYIGREKLGPMTYRDMRPLHSIERLKEYNKYMSYEIFSWIWHGWSPAIPFMFTRWNYGEDDALALLKEFDDHYYGAAGKYVTEIELMLEEFARNYKHTPEEIAAVRRGKPIHVGLRCGAPYVRSRIPRAMFDKIYELLDRGLAEIGKSNDYARKHTLYEKAYYLYEDLNAYRLADCRNEAEVAAYAERAAEFVRIAREEPRARKKLNPLHTSQEHFTTFTGVVIETKGKEWCFTPEVEKFLADPVKALTVKPEKIPGGLLFPPGLMKGGFGTQLYNHKCPPRIANFIHRASSGRGEIAINFKLDKAPAEATMLALTGLDDDKPGTGRFAVEVNGKRVFEGKNTFPERQWGYMGVAVPGGVLKGGMNVIKFINTTPEDSGNYDAAGDYTWGWTGFAEAALLDPNGGFKTFLAGGKNSGWSQAKQRFNTPPGKVKVEGGKLHITGGKAKCTGVAFFRHHKSPKLAVSPYKRLRIRAVASGKGKLALGVWPYGAKGHLGRSHGVKTFDLAPEPRPIECIIELPAEVQRIVPEISVEGNGSAVVESYSIEFLK